MRFDLIKEISSLYDINCKPCAVKKARDGNRRKGGVYVDASKERCERCHIYRKMEKLRKQLEG